MSLLLLDLDNTLIDRDAAFRRWATQYLADLGATDSAVDWLVATEHEVGSRAEDVASTIRDRFGLDAPSTTDVLAELRRGLVEHISLDPAVVLALQSAQAAGWVPFVITNGAVHQQERKLRHTGLDQHVAGWVISEAAGVAKPEPAIFHLAAAEASQPLDGAWMIGDSADNDIAGAYQLGLSSVWLHRGRPWPTDDFRPTRLADSCPHAVDLVLATAASSPSLS